MEFNVPKVNFILKTRDISLLNGAGNFPLSNQFGSINSSRTSTTWNAINIKNILGELYDQYELFNIELIGISIASYSGNFGTTDNDRNVIINMSGLDWVYNNYNTSSLSTTNQAIVGSHKFATQAAAQSFSNIRRMISTFRKNQVVDITITLTTVQGTLPNINAGQLFPFQNYAFVITPVS
jgi:hypothetical protein